MNYLRLPTKSQLLWLRFSLGVVFLLTLQWVSLSSLRVLDTSWVEPSEERKAKWDPVLTRTVSFGHLPAVIDWLWMMSLLESNISHVAKGTHPQIYYDLDLITDLDPAFFEIYPNGANLLAVIRNDGLGARDLLLKGKAFLEKGLTGYPLYFRESYRNQAWNISMLLGYVYLFEMNDMPHAAVEFKEAALLPSSPPYLTRLARRLEKPGGEYEVGLHLLSFMIVGAKDARVQEQLEKKKLNLLKGQFIYNVNLSFQEYLSTLQNYNPNSTGLSQKLPILFKEYLKATHTPSQDPWGGVLFVGGSGRVQSTVPHEAVFGLE